MKKSPAQLDYEIAEALWHPVDPGFEAGFKAGEEQARHDVTPRETLRQLRTHARTDFERGLVAGYESICSSKAPYHATRKHATPRFPETHLKGRRSPSHSTKKQPNGNKAWYAFYIPKGRMPKSFGGKSGWDWPKAYFGPYESRAAASSAVQDAMRALDEPATRYKIRNVTPYEFAKLWGSPPQDNFVPPWSVET